MPQQPHKRALKDLIREAVRLSADYEQTLVANAQEGPESHMRFALEKMLPQNLPDTFFLGAMFGIDFCVDLMHTVSKKQRHVLVPGQKPTSPINRFFHAAAHMAGLAALRATQAKKEKA